MHFEGVLKKMKTEPARPVNYFLALDGDFLHINQLMGQKLAIKHMGYECLGCGLNKKIFRQGYCYDCFMSLPQAGDWIMRPELSRAHLDEEDRDLSYEKQMQLQPHIVYLAQSGGLKVGVTRATQVPTRWIDQGATEAIALVEVPNRYLAGVAEVALKNHYSDKTHWQKMLKNQEEKVDLNLVREQAKVYLPEEILPYYSKTDSGLYQIHYPVSVYPNKVRSLTLDKNPDFIDTLSGVRGQYLIFESGAVFNVRNHEGFRVGLDLG
ncbi:MAG: DUF2797 domain-containing protein [Flavobacteriaceae bacterium]|nr:DUF2797 domain-containing protein [Flavobacteriaceae bacterium]